MTLSAFILGAGPRIGRSVALKLKDEGYKVAVGSRSPDVEETTRDGLYPIRVDASMPETIQGAFDQVRREIGTPNVVVFNASALTFPPTPKDPLSIPLASFIHDQAVGVNSIFALAQCAVQGFGQLPASTPRAFIVTGNLLPFVAPVPNMVTLGSQKVGSAYLVRLFAKAYAEKGHRFYYAQQVSSTGGNPGNELSGSAHATAYWNLVQREEQGEWDYRFTKDGSVYKEHRDALE